MAELTTHYDGITGFTIDLSVEEAKTLAALIYRHLGGQHPTRQPLNRLGYDITEALGLRLVDLAPERTGLSRRTRGGDA
jgi:hypothetical protein